MKKYKLVNYRQEISSYQIKALRDIPNTNVKKGDLGGWVESENNLSHEGNAWVYDSAQVYGNARVCGNVQVYGNARVYGNAKVYGNARVYGNAKVYGNAWVSGNAQVYGNARVYGTAWVYDSAQVYGNARVYSYMYIGYGRTDCDLFSNIKLLIQNSLNILPLNNKYILYKHVNQDLESLYNKSFKYKTGKVIKEKNVDLDKTKSCTSGLHVSMPTYWQNQGGSKVIACEVNIKDIITCLEGKVRCRKLKVLGVVQNGDYKDEQ